MTDIKGNVFYFFSLKIIISFGNCIVCPSSIYDFGIPFQSLQTVLNVRCEILNKCLLHCHVAYYSFYWTAMFIIKNISSIYFTIVKKHEKVNHHPISQTEDSQCYNIYNFYWLNNSSKYYINVSLGDPIKLFVYVQIL